MKKIYDDKDFNILFNNKVIKNNKNCLKFILFLLLLKRLLSSFVPEYPIEE